MFLEEVQILSACSANPREEEIQNFGVFDRCRNVLWKCLFEKQPSLEIDIVKVSPRRSIRKVLVKFYRFRDCFVPIINVDDLGRTVSFWYLFQTRFYHFCSLSDSDGSIKLNPFRSKAPYLSDPFQLSICFRSVDIPRYLQKWSKCCFFLT